jgi:exosortase/archaeosortase family protein
LRFVFLAAPLMCVLYAAYYYPYASDSLPGRLLHGFLVAQSHAAGWVIALFDAGVSVEGTQIRGRFPLAIVKACSSLDAQALLVASVVAFPARLPGKLLGVLGGTLAMTGLNVARIAALYFVGAHAPQAFDTVHEEVMPLLLIAAACAAFALWASWVRGQAERHAVA